MSDKTIRFPSVLNAGSRMFVYESSATANWDMCYRTGSILSYQSFWYETFGDGNTQHTPFMCVPLGETAADWMLSLAQHLLEHPKDYDFTLDSLFGYDLPQANVVKFLASLKEKHIGQYYSILETSVSKSENRRHDKRWFKVGSFPFTLSSQIERIAQFWFQGTERRIKAIEQIGLLCAIGDGLNEGFSACELTRFNWLTAETLSYARALREVLQALISMKNCRSNVECHIGNALRSRQAQAA